MQTILEIVVVVIYVLAKFAEGLVPPCCAQTTLSSCRTACEQTSLVAIGISQAERKLRLQVVDDYCPKELTSFWKCMNDTVQVIELGDNWIGRHCCHFPQSRSCRLQCLRSTSRDDLAGGCRQSDEIAFYNCLDRQQVGERCCSNAQTFECRNVCMEIFRSNLTPSRQVRNTIVETCAPTSPKVLHCVRNFTKTTPAGNPQKNIHCCQRSSNELCRSNCVNVLKTKETSQEIVDELSKGGCGPPLLHDRMWQCFLSNSDASRPDKVTPARSERVNVDAAKLHCCSKAATPICQKLCFKTFSNEWASNWDDFDRKCQYHDGESKMLQCLADVDEPCELGCEGLGYCTNFNNRPTELFRNCNARADRAAQKDVEIWQQGFIHMPAMMIPVKDITKCYPWIWKAIACTLQIKPCHNRHANMICKSDCINILSKCIDYDRLPEGTTPVSVCNALSPSADDFPCISLDPYLVSNAYDSSMRKVTYPCRTSPCNATEVCIVNRDCQNSQNCKTYSCVPGCKMGDASQLVVPKDTFVLVPVSSSNSGCQKVCHCREKCFFQDCVMLPCHSTDSCWYKNNIYTHNTVFHDECKVCVCHSGDMVCSQRNCMTQDYGQISAYTGLPCNCPNHYVPVCGSNGRTYPSSCLATCTGLSLAQIQIGSCSNLNPCHNNPCKIGEKCIWTKKVCLSRKASCKQYECVEMSKVCKGGNPICLVDSTKDLCMSIKQNGRQVEYGQCHQNCQNSAQICGHDGETYPNQCSARTDRASIDYYGPCLAVGPITDGMRAKCSNVTCPVLQYKTCPGVTPPGACCPVCGGALRLLYNSNRVDAISSVLADHPPITVKSVVQALRRHVKVLECDVFGYLSLEGDLIVLILPTSSKPSSLHVDTCTREADRIQSLIASQSPTVMTELPLSILMSAETFHDQNNGGQHHICNYNTVFALILSTILYYLVNS